MENPLSELPLGLGMALVQDPDAMARFTALSAEERQRVVEQTRAIHSHREMAAFIMGGFRPEGL